MFLVVFLLCKFLRKSRLGNDFDVFCSPAAPIPDALGVVEMFTSGETARKDKPRTLLC